MGRRDDARLVRAALRVTGLSPEAFAVAHRALLGGVTGRTVRRWAAEDHPVPPLVVVNLRTLTPSTEET